LEDRWQIFSIRLPDRHRVLDFTQFEAGTSCTQVLAWLGADVVKIENPQGGDPGRRAGARSRTRTILLPELQLQQALDRRQLKSPRGLQIVKDLAKKADVFMENFAPGAIERLGLGYDVLCEDQSGHHLRAGERLRRRQPVREQSRLRHDRAGLRRAHEHHRRARRPPAKPGRRSAIPAPAC
jgi:hypothetical protein